METATQRTPRQWMALGYKVLIRCSRAWLWKPGSRTAHVAGVDRGNWMWSTDLDAPPWQERKLTEGQLANFTAAARDCYCGSCGIDRCDFCNSCRTPDGAPSSNGREFWH